MLLYSRKKVRYRRDGYCWKKRKDGKTTREDHMKLKVQGMEVSSIKSICFCKLFTTTYCVNSTRQALLPIIRGETCKLSSTSTHTNLCRKVCLVWNLAFSKILHCTVGKSSSKSVILWVCEGSEPIVWLAKFQFPRLNGLDVVDKQTLCSLHISMAFNLGS